MSTGMFGVELIGQFCHASKSLATFMIPTQWLCSMVPIAPYLPFYLVAVVNVEPLHRATYSVCNSILLKDGVQAITRVRLVEVFKKDHDV